MDIGPQEIAKVRLLPYVLVYRMPPSDQRAKMREGVGGRRFNSGKRGGVPQSRETKRPTSDEVCACGEGR